MCSAMLGFRRNRLLGDERGSFLIEVMVTAGIVLVAGLGVLTMVDRTTELSGQQRTQAVAGNIAQVELDRVKALPLSQLSNLRSTSSRTVGGVAYAIKKPNPWPGVFGYHEVFHAMTVVAAICHYIAVYFAMYNSPFV